MITPLLIERLLASAPPQPLRDGTRYAEQARVGTFIGSSSSVSTVVRGRQGDHEVVLWSEGAELRHRCQCEAWRDPCRHAIAAALVLRQWITRPAEESPAESRPRAKGRRGTAKEQPTRPASPRARPGEPDARTRALEERTVAGRRERMRIRMAEAPPLLLVQSGSGFEYRVHLHGGVALKARPGLISAFREQPGAAVFISTDAGGVGLNLQVADAVVNLDVPWNPARLEQRVARVHRIGSRNTVNEVLIVAKGTVEHGILLQHETKKNVLANVWGKNGDDVVKAPGGSGAFRDMIKALLATSAPDEVRATEAAEEVVLPPVAPARLATVAGRERAATPQAPAERVADPGGLDLASLGRALAAVAPTLPAEHRQSLAAVFRAMASALELGEA